MEFLTDEKITELGIDKSVIEKIAPLHSEYVANLKKEYDGKANQNAEAILTGAAAKIEEATGIKRNQGEKQADYYVRAGKEFLAAKESSLENAKAEYEKKLKEVGNGDATAKELEKARQDYDALLQKYADYDDLKTKAEKYEPLEKEYASMKQQVAFGSVKPSFPDTVNPYEAKAKWEEFVKGVNEKYTVEIVENEAIAIDKENHHKQVKLADLLKQDKQLSELLAGRQQTGTGAKPTEKTIDGVPFAVPENATSAEISKLINDHLDKQGIVKTDSKRPKLFFDLHAKIKGKQ